MKLFDGPKIVYLRDCDIHVHYANNRGRGRDNVTLTFVAKGTPRRANTQYADHLMQYRVSGWRGIVNVPSDDIKKFGGYIDAE
jgi:hypothetical protein